MRVTFLTHYYPPEVGAPQARISTLARLLAERGVSVTVHTGFPHYPDGRVKRPYRVRPYRVERDGPVRVVRSAVYPAPNRGFGRRLAGHLSFAASALLSARVAGGADVVVGETPPLFTAAATIPYARLVGAAAVLNVADRWPASAVALGALRSPPAIRAAERLERACYRHTAAITVPTEGLAADLGRLREASGKVARVGPAVDTDRFQPLPGREADGPLRLLYAGTIGLAQGVDTLVEAARMAGPEVEVAIAGDGAEAARLREGLRRDPTANVRLLGAVRHEHVPALYRDVDAAAVLLRDRPVFESALPTKLLEAMAAGRPVLLSARGESGRVVEAAGAGVVVPPGDAAALADAMRRLRADRPALGALGAAGRSYVERHFAWDATVARWHKLLERVAAQDPNSP
jgi:glycosyltransferase involved in cell wall biosynthesis